MGHKGLVLRFSGIFVIEFFNMPLSKIEVDACLNFFNQGGYVLDFSSAGFDDFTENVIGVRLCGKYQLSKGKSLEAYVREATEYDVVRLFSALLQHYELSPDIDHDRASNLPRFRQYEKCKEIVEKAAHGGGHYIAAEQIKREFDSDYINSQIDLMLKMRHENPTEAIGKAKELIESCCKTILNKVGIEIQPKWSITNLIDEVFKHFKIMPRDIDDNVKGAGSIKKVLGSLKAIAHGVAELRNFYGSGHGKMHTYQGLEPRHAQLAIGSSITLVQFMWDSYKRNYVVKTNEVDNV